METERTTSSGGGSSLQMQQLQMHQQQIQQQEMQIQAFWDDRLAEIDSINPEKVGPGQLPKIVEPRER